MIASGEPMKGFESSPRDEILQLLQTRPEGIPLAELKERFSNATLLTALRELADHGLVGYTGPRENRRVVPSSILHSVPEENPSTNPPLPSPEAPPADPPSIPSLETAPEKPPVPSDPTSATLPTVRPPTSSGRSPRPVSTSPTVLVCARCGKMVVELAVWSLAEGQFVHIEATQLSFRGTTEVCGGRIVLKGEEWRHALAPGTIVPCYRTRRDLAHLVRLGHPLRHNARLWGGTALCGLLGTKPTAKWEPLSPAEAARAKLCPECKRAQPSGGEP